MIPGDDYLVAGRTICRGAWPSTVDPASGSERLFLTIDAIVKGAEYRAFVLRSGIPTLSLDALGVVLAGQAALRGQPEEKLW